MGSPNLPEGVVWEPYRPKDIFQGRQGRSSPESVEWKQYNLWEPEKPGRFRNDASIGVFVRKMMARERKRARGIDPIKELERRKALLELFAAEWQRKKEEATKIEQEKGRGDREVT